MTSATSPHQRAAIAKEGSREAMRRVELPLRDLEYAIEAYLLAHGQHLDTGTRCFLARVRDGVERVAQAAREMSNAAEATPPDALRTYRAMELATG